MCVFVVSSHRGCMCDLNMLGVIADVTPMCCHVGEEGYEGMCEAIGVS